MSILHLKEVDLYYESIGCGNPPLVFIHGYTCDHTDWEFQVKRLRDTYQVVTCDLRGYGQSTGVNTNGTIEDFASDVNSLIRTLNLRGAILIGHSMGCRVVLETYLQNPGSVSGIILIDGSRMGQGNPQEVVAAFKKSIEQIGFQKFTRHEFNGMFLGEFDTIMKDRLTARAINLDPQYCIRVRSGFPGWDAAKMESALSNLKVPLLIIQGTGINENLKRYSLKKGDNTSWLNLVKRLVPTAGIEIIPDRGHFIMLEAPDRTCELIISFAEKLKKRRL
jgi:pimeloyl-ACP methyl ester carboxylesterase